MVDIHSHILPNIDDGAKTIEHSIEMMKIAKSDGITKIIATPHYYRGKYENKYVDVVSEVKKINEKAKELGIGLEIYAGQEVFLDSATLALYKENVVTGINDTKYMLIELPMDAMPKETMDRIYELRVLGVVPIIAHPERYSYIIEKPSAINVFIDEKCLFQINSGSIKGIFGKKVQKTAETLINNGVCNFIASDAHSTSRRCPQINEGLSIADSLNGGIKAKFMENGEKLLNNEEIIVVSEKIKDKKSIFSFFRR